LRATAAVAAFSVPVTDLGDHLAAFDINPLICGPAGPRAVILRPGKRPRKFIGA
jgi:hypothetical protein